jgi:hypothetical protein
MKRITSAFLGFVISILMIAPALAAPLPYINTPMDTINAGLNTVVSNINAALPNTQYLSSCTGTTTATCPGLRIAASYTGLTTAAGVTSALQTVTDTSVTAASMIQCQVNGYAGTGNPVAVNVIPGAGSFTYQIQNTHASAALNATVVTMCIVYN